MMTVLVGFLLSSVVYRGSLLNAGIVRLPFDLGVWRKAENALCCLSIKSVSAVLPQFPH